MGYVQLFKAHIRPCRVMRIISLLKFIKMQKYPLISELTFDQKCHMAWRADRHTGFGLIQISRICRGYAGDIPVNKAFEMLDMTPHQAKLHATAVVKYHPATYKPIKS